MPGTWGPVNKRGLSTVRGASASVPAHLAVGCVGSAAPSFPPDHVTLQWHITDRCNLACTHCYQDDAVPADTGWPNLVAILEQCRAWRRELAAMRGGRSVRLHINVTGGEPMAHPDALRLLRLLSGSRGEWSFALLSNGTLFDDALARQTAALKPEFVQVSIDGEESTHDGIRGQGAFARAVEGIRHLKRHGVRTLIAFTASRANYREFPAVARLGLRLGVSRVWVDRVVPLGRADQGSCLGPDETRALVEMIRGEQRAPWPWKRRPQIAAHRALQFAASGGTPYRCAAGSGLVTILSNGDLCPCRRMPTFAGNALRDGIATVYRESEVFRCLREHTAPPAGCEACFFSKTCAGGLRCLAAAIHGDPFVADPGCWLRRSTAPRASERVHTTQEAITHG